MVHLALSFLAFEVKRGVDGLYALILLRYYGLPEWIVDLTHFLTVKTK